MLGQLQNAVSMVFCPIVICSEYLWYYMQVCTAYGIIYQHAVSNEYGIIYQYAVIIVLCIYQYAVSMVLCTVHYIPVCSEYGIIYQYAVNMVLYTSMQCSLVFRANRSFFMSKGAICSWKRVNRSHCSLKKSNRAKSNGSILLLGIKRGKAVKNIQKIRIYSSEMLVFWEQFAWITSKSLMSLSLKEWRERLSHGRSFVKRDKSKLLTQLLFKMSDFERNCKFPTLELYTSIQWVWY